jgi:hypothetical protein
MHGDQIEEALATANESTKGWDDTMSRGRALVDEAAQATIPAERISKLRQATRQFQSAIGLHPSKDEGYGWLARALRLLAQAIRERDPEASTICLRHACAAAWEARVTTPASSLSVFTKQEAKTLLAWVRMSKRLDPKAGESQMEALRAEFLTAALDPERMAAVTGV